MYKENFFKILDLPVSFLIDEAKLDFNYIAKQKQVHPDIAGAEFSQASSLLNSAYSVLKNPVARAEHFLVVNGYNIDSTNSEVLAMEMFKIRSEYSSLQSGKEEYREKLREKMQNLVGQLTKLEDDLDRFYEVFCLLKFINSFLENSDGYSWD